MRSSWGGAAVSWGRWDHSFLERDQNVLFKDYEQEQPVHSPVRTQYLRIKEQNPDAILFFRMGDFYEMFDDDAEIVARELEIALTRRDFGRG